MTIHWYRADVTRPTHPKLKKLARRLGVSRMHAIGIHDVLCVIPTVAGRSDGFLGSMDAEDLAIAVDWEADPEILLETLIDLAIIDRDPDGSLYVHGFAERASKEAAKRAADRDRKRADRRTHGASGASGADTAPEEKLSESCPPDIQRTGDGHGPVSRGNSTRTNVRTYERTERENARTPDEVISPGDPTIDGDPSLALDGLGDALDALDLPTPALEVDRPASAKPGPLPRAVVAEDDDRLRQAMAAAAAAPPPPDDLLDETTGPKRAIAAYNDARHPSLPEASDGDTGLRAAVWATIRNGRAEARAARERGDPEPEHPMHRLAGWRELGERTHAALFLHPRRDGPMMRPTPTLLFFTKGRDGCLGAANRSALYAGTWDEIRREQARETAAERQIRESFEQVIEAREQAGASRENPMIQRIRQAKALAAGA